MNATASITQIKPAALARKVDQLGELNAQIADLTRKTKVIKEALVKSGLAEVEGKHFRAVIVHKKFERLDAKKARAFLTVQQIVECSTTVESDTVSLYDR